MKINLLVVKIYFIFVSFFIFATLTPGQQIFPARYYSPGIEFDHITTNKILINNTIGKDAPVRMAYWVPRHHSSADLSGLELQSISWQPFKPEILVDLGAGTGERDIRLAVEWENPKEYQQAQLAVNVDDSIPTVAITYPTNKITAQPWLQLEGYASGYMMNSVYTISNSLGVKSNQDCFSPGENRFHCYDIALASGTNSITFSCEIAGNKISTNIEVVFTTVGDTSPPVITPIWPTNGMSISGPTITARGILDDYTASLQGVIIGGGQTNKIEGLVERNGTYWVENIPLLGESNQLVLIAVDAAGNASKVNLALTKSEVELVIESTPEGENLYKPTGLVTGRVTPGYDVYVNGSKAMVKPDGHWRVDEAPIYGRGTATFDATAVPSEVTWAAKNTAAGVKNLLTAVADIKAEPIIINANQSACGNFAIRLTGTYGKKFILMDSTNLLDWSPILTNLISTPTFDYTDTNSANYQCRFFKVVPLP